MAEDFSKLMAQTIAQARPQQAPTPRGHTVMAGGGRGGFGTEKASSAAVNVNVELEPFMKLFGWKSPEEKAKISEQFQKTRNSLSDQDWKQYVKQEPVQKVMESLYKTGYLGFVQTPEGMYDLPRTTPEARAAEMTPEQIMAGAAGPGPRGELISGKAEAIRGAETEAERALRMAEAEARSAVAEAERERLKYTKDEQDRLKAESDSLVKFRADQGYYYRMMGDKALRDAEEKGTVPKEQIETLKSVLNTWRSTRDTLDTAFADVTTISALGRWDTLFDILTSAVRGHLEGVGGVTTDMGPGNESFGYWLSMLSDRLLIEQGQEKFAERVPWYGGKPKEVDPEATLRWMRHSGNLVNFMQQMGKDISPVSALQALDLFIRIYEIMPPTGRMNQYASFIKTLGESYGFDMSALVVKEVPKREEEKK